MNHSDIKLVIDQLDQLDFGNIEDKHVVGNAINALETLGNQVAKQAAVIEKLRDVLEYYANTTYDMFPNTARKALSTPTDSAQVLQEWLDEKLGNPFTYVYRYHSPFGGDETELSFTRCTNEAIESIPLFKKPEKL